MKRAAAKFQYDKHAGDQLQPIGLGEFVHMKPSPHHKGGPWPYGVVAEIPTTRSYIVDTPTGMTRRNRAHVQPAAPPPAGSLVAKSCGKHLNRSQGPINPPSLKPTRETTINPPEEVNPPSRVPLPVMDDLEPVLTPSVMANEETTAAPVAPVSAVESQNTVRKDLESAKSYGLMYMYIILVCI